MRYPQVLRLPSRLVPFRAVALAGVLLALAWPRMRYEDRFAMQAAAVVHGSTSPIATMAAAMGDLPMNATVMGGPVIGRPFLDLLRGIIEPQSAALQKLIGVKSPLAGVFGAVGATPPEVRPGGLYPIRKLLENIAYALAIPLLLVGIGIKMIQEHQNVRDATLGALKPWSIAILALFLYPLVDVLAYWGIARPAAAALGSYEIKSGLILGALQSKAVDNSFEKWASKKIEEGRNLKTRNLASGGPAVAAGMNLSITCAKALSGITTLKDAFRPTADGVSYELRECRNRAMAVETRIVIMRNIMSMAPTFENSQTATSGADGEPSGLVEVAELINEQPQLAFQIFEHEPSAAAVSAAIASNTDGRSWFRRMIDWFSGGIEWLQQVGNPLRMMGEFLEKTVAGVLAGVLNLILTAILLIFYIEAEFGRAFSLALAPIAIAYAMVPGREGGKLAEWAKHHFSVSLRVVGAELASLLVMVLTLGIMLMPMRAGTFGLVMSPFILAIGMVALWVSAKNISKAMSGDVVAAASSMTSGLVTATKVAIGGAALTAVGAAAGSSALASKVSGLAKGASNGTLGKAVKSATRASRWVQANKARGDAVLGGGKDGQGGGVAQRAGTVAKRILNASANEARARNARAVENPEALGDRNAELNAVVGKMARIEKDFPTLTGLALRIAGDTLPSGRKVTVAEATSSPEVRAEIAAAVKAQEERLKESLRFASDKERARAKDMMVTFTQALAAAAASQGGKRDALTGRYGVDAKGNRTFELDKDGQTTLLQGLEVGGRALQEELRRAAFDLGMDDALTADLKDLVARAPAAQAVLGLLAERDIEAKQALTTKMAAIAQAGVPLRSVLQEALLEDPALNRRANEDEASYATRIREAADVLEQRAMAALENLDTDPDETGAFRSSGRYSDAMIMDAGTTGGFVPDASLRAPKLTDKAARARMEAAITLAQEAVANEAAFWETMRIEAGPGVNVDQWRANGYRGLTATAPLDSLYSDQLEKTMRRLGKTLEDFQGLSAAEQDLATRAAWFEAAAYALADAARESGESIADAMGRLGLKDGANQIVRETVKERLMADATLRARVNQAVLLSGAQGGLGRVDTPNPLKVVNFGSGPGRPIVGKVTQGSAEDLAVLADELSGALRAAGASGGIDLTNASLRQALSFLGKQQAEALKALGKSLDEVRASGPRAFAIQGLATANGKVIAREVAKALSAWQSGQGSSVAAEVRALRKELSRLAS